MHTLDVFLYGCVCVLSSRESETLVLVGRVYGLLVWLSSAAASPLLYFISGGETKR
jgi:hypothetical protein